MEQARRLEDLARAADRLDVEVRGNPDTRVTGVAYDSRLVRPGDLFFCLPGTVTDGHRFAHSAVRAGAVALCAERPTGAPAPEVLVADSRRAMGRICAEFFGQPADDLTLIGVTGTNGKTTTCFLLDSILAADGRTTGLIGTIETRIAGEARAGVRTTPESPDLQRLLAQMRSRGVDSVTMEVTSHALALHRVEGLRFVAAAFTNLSQDHLDFHAGMRDYFEAKRSLFTPERVEAGAANIDDPYGRELLEMKGLPWLAFGVSEGAQVRAENVRTGAWGSEFVAYTPAGDVKVACSLIGLFNVHNCLASVATALQAGIAVEAIETGIRALKAVPGRFEPIDLGQGFAVVVDYAHTPDSLDNALKAARFIAQERGGRVVAVFGCGGDRDRSKRPVMGAVAARRADVLIVTSDNPRSEDPEAIIGEILEGVAAQRPEKPDRVLIDRREAIDVALRLADDGDVVLIAGKGHETGQQFAEATVPFDDREVARESLRALGWGGP